MAPSRPPGSPPAARTRCGSRSTAPRHAGVRLRVDERALVLRRRRGRRTAASGASWSPSRPIPTSGAWWPPGHLLGYEHSFTHQVVDLVRTSRRAATRPRRSPTACRCSGCSRRSSGRGGVRQSGGGEGRRCLAASASSSGAESRPGGVSMARPITLFTGQWADLPFEEVCRLAGEWGYDGLEIACWGDHFDLVGGRRGRRLRRRPPRDPREARPRGLRDLQPPHRPGRLRRPDRRAAPRDPARPGLGRRRAGGRAAARRRGDAGRRHGPPPARRATRSSASPARRSGRPWRCSRRCPQSMIDAGYQRLRRPLEPDPRRVRRGGRAVRARGAPQRDRLRLLDGGARAGGDRAPPGVRAELGPEPLRVAGPRPGRVPLGLPGPDLPRGLQGREAPGRQRPQRAYRARTLRGRQLRRGWDFVSTGHGDVPAVPLVDRVVADGLPGEVVRDRGDLEAVRLEDVAPART